jgi:hypothetical protein
VPGPALLGNDAEPGGLPPLVASPPGSSNVSALKSSGDSVAADGHEPVGGNKVTTTARSAGRVRNHTAWTHVGGDLKEVPVENPKFNLPLRRTLTPLHGTSMVRLGGRFILPYILGSTDFKSVRRGRAHGISRYLVANLQVGNR